MSKKIISALLIGILSVTSLTGCSNKDEKDNKETTTATNSENKYDNLTGEWATDLTLDELKESYASLLSQVEEKNRYYGLEYELKEDVQETKEELVNENYMYLVNENAEKNRLESAYFGMKTYGEDLSKGQIIMKIVLNFDGERALNEENFDFGETSLAKYSSIMTKEEERDYEIINEQIIEKLKSKKGEGVVVNDINGLYEEFVVSKDYIVYILETKKFDFTTKKDGNITETDTVTDNDVNND
ncbi:MAG: hypothetical protein MSA89_05960 [Clostridium sp.]|nr:hypothetical protein [Clostridium sp.]MCI7442615.1 hypothetical protein [Clostridium sp.]